MRHLTPWPALATAGLLLSAPPALAASDPLEGFNRRIHDFNLMLRERVLDPAVAAYVAHASPAFRAGVANAFANLREPVTAASGLLAGQFDVALNAAARFGINTSLGLGGVHDAAADRGYPRQDFTPADAVCRWGVPGGPFLMLPLLGPSTLRDAGALVGTGLALSATLGPEIALSWRGSDALVAYAGIAEDLARTDAQALDSYAIYRSAYLQRRAARCGVEVTEDSATD
ncbi:MlaA family lipoprotein [Falsiroseomonas sp. HC035]|uniref:MlaA family lipoprotein n=1 Tax=Falsiroseomonas sp. HC035 TaxID=3390999 RepID=UPI003D3163DB